jgi:hypothetical protein
MYCVSSVLSRYIPYPQSIGNIQVVLELNNAPADVHRVELLIRCWYAKPIRMGRRVIVDHVKGFREESSAEVYQLDV